MNPITAANILNWCVFALVFTCVITFACAVHEQFINGRRRKRHASRTVTVVPPSVSHREPNRSAAEKLIVRGYDSPELLREDLWLLRLDRSRKNIALLNTAGPPVEAIIGTHKSHEQRVSAMLAQYAGVRCDN